MDNRHKIVAGLREAISYAKGDRSRSRVTQFNVPDTINVRQVREKLGMSQTEFAVRFGFSLATLRQWEQGRRQPDGPARVFLTVIKHAPKAVDQALIQAAREDRPLVPVNVKQVAVG
jgi:putative transcriptional regulator